MRNFNVWINPDINMSEIKDSMQLDSCQVIATLTDAYGIVTSIEVRGDVKVWWNPNGENPFEGMYYCSPSDFPLALKEIIANNPYWYEDKRLYICENNWFEVFTWHNSLPYTCDSYTVDAEESNQQDLIDLLFEGYRYEKKDLFRKLAHQKAKSFAIAAVYFYNHGDIKSASKYWNKIYSLKHIDSHDLITVNRLFSDDAVYAITDYLKEKMYYGC